MFRFRFEQVLNVRKLAEDQALQEFSEQVRGLEFEKDRLRSIRGEKAAVLAELMRRQEGTLHAGEIASCAAAFPFQIYRPRQPVYKDSISYHG